MKVTESAEQLPSGLALDGETLAPYYQPIIALDSGRIMGYEVLGRAVKDGKARSLGPFFGNADIPAEDHLLVDRLLRDRAIARLGQERNPPMLFLNLKPEWISRHGCDGVPHTLQLIEKHGADPRSIVIEITEENYSGSMDKLRSDVDGYRERGCRIAIDDVGSGFSSVDRIAQIQPNLLKIDMNMVKRSATHNGYFGVLRSFSELAEQIGASLLFEGVETIEDFERAIQSGARYVQGFLFAQAAADFIRPNSFAPIIERELERHLRALAETEQGWHRKAEALAGRLHIPERAAELADGGDGWLERLLPELDDNCMKVYLCNKDGIQLSSNFRRDADMRWVREEQFRHANWSWRPYFVPNLVQLGEHRRAIVSRAYADLDSQEWIRTVSVLVRPDLILFADMKDIGSRGERR